MSFQGDVRGIGLAELLQSLASGRREGVLTLTGRTGLYSTLGLQGGQIFFLPNPDEDPNVWRQRAARAWADQTEPRVDHLRMSDIARARRIETLYQLLDSEGVHFRFQPGELPKRPVEGAENDPTKNQAEEVHCPGAPVEYLLFEYARMTDEGEGVGAKFVDPGLVLRVVDATAGSDGGTSTLVTECQSGSSDLTEIADRLGWPARQVCNEAAKLLHAGALRVAAAPEFLTLAREELGRMQIDRAAARLSSWLRFSQPGPMPDTDANIVMSEWNAGRVQKLLHQLPATDGRRLLRRLQAGRLEPCFCIPQWVELQKIHPHDRIIELRVLVLEARDEEDPDRPAIRSLLHIARWMRESGKKRRAGVILRLAADHMPATAAARLEVGTGMIAAGMTDLGVPWVMEAALQLMERGEFEKAIPALRKVLEESPRHREARRLYSRARSQTLRRRVVKKHSLVGFAVLISLSAVAYVQRRNEQKREDHMSEISQHLGDPEEAQRLLARYFGDEQTAEIVGIRAIIEERRRTEDAAARAAWNDRYRETQTELTLGDPVHGLERALDLPPPPQLHISGDPFPLISDLHDGLAARFETNLKDLGEVNDDDEQARREQKILSQVDEIRKLIGKQESDDNLSTLSLRLDSLRRKITARRQKRESERRATELASIRSGQDVLLATARSHANAGDFKRALAAYEELVTQDDGNRLVELPTLRREIQDAQTKWKAILQARELAVQGEHAEAILQLEQELGLDGLQRHLLPWRAESFPSGATVQMPSGETLTTPFEWESGIGEEFSLMFLLDGHEPVEVELDTPGDLHVLFSLRPQFTVTSSTKFEAPPLALDDDFLCVDRDGRVFRATSEGEIVWERNVGTINGIARAPVLLPGAGAGLLVVAENGEAWVFDPRDGTPQGPARLGSPPLLGPVAAEGAVYCSLVDGRVARWEHGVEPNFGPFEKRLLTESGKEARFGGNAGLAILRRTDAQKELSSPSGRHRVVIENSQFSIFEGDATEPTVIVLRNSTFHFVAWDSSGQADRLWISDAAGLRSFRL